MIGQMKIVELRERARAAINRDQRLLSWPIYNRLQIANLPHSDLAFAPDGLAADSCPAAGFEPGKKFGEISFVFRDADEAADRMALSGAAAAAFGFDVLTFAGSHLH